MYNGFDGGDIVVGLLVVEVGLTASSGGASGTQYIVDGADKEAALLGALKL